VRLTAPQPPQPVRFLLGFFFGGCFKNGNALRIAEFLRKRLITSEVIRANFGMIFLGVTDFDGFASGQCLACGDRGYEIFDFFFDRIPRFRRDCLGINNDVYIR